MSNHINRLLVIIYYYIKILIFQKKILFLYIDYSNKKILRKELKKKKMSISKNYIENKIININYLSENALIRQ